MRPFALRVMAALVLALLLSSPGRGQQSAPIDLENADSLKGLVIDGQDARELIGNVRIRQERVVITCDRALQYIAQERVQMTGHVVVKDDSVLLRAPRAIYHGSERRAEAFEDVRLDDGRTSLSATYGEYFMNEHRARFQGRVHVEDSSSFVDSDTLHYLRDGGRARASGNVSVTGKNDRVVISGGHLDHSAEPPYSRMTGDPTLVRVDTATGARDTLTVASDVMEAFRDSTRLLVATDSVRFLQGELAGICRQLRFFTANDSLQLRGTPVVWYGETQVAGDSINVYLRNRKLYRVAVLGSAFTVSRSDSAYATRFDQMTGDSLFMRFGENGLEEIDARSQATSIYHLYEDSLGNGLNRSSCDRIVLVFRDRKLQQISFIGGVEGTYVPENLLFKREGEYRLPGFVWRGDRPTRESLRKP
jgi:lipopolysaccharide export system protein LptA